MADSRAAKEPTLVPLHILREPSVLTLKGSQILDTANPNLLMAIGWCSTNPSDALSTIILTNLVSEMKKFKQRI